MTTTTTPKKIEGGHGEGYGTGLPNDVDYTDTELRWVAQMPKETLMTTTRFEERLRAIAADNPRLSVGAALRLAEQDGEYIEFPADPSDVETGALWALQQPEVVSLINESRTIMAIKVIRELAPKRYNPRNGVVGILALYEAKQISDRVRDLLSEKVSGL